MGVDLKNLFSHIADVPNDEKPVDTVVCDIYGTLLPDSRALDNRLHDFLLSLKKKGADVILASGEAASAVKDLQSAGCDPWLLEEGVQDKMKMQYDLASSDKHYAAIDDTTFIWLEAPICINPASERFQNFLRTVAPQFQ